jgi:hypothetical protein
MMRTWGWPRRLPGPALSVVLLALVVHVIRQNPVDILVFAAVAALIVAEPRLTVRARPRPAWLLRWPVPVTTAVALAGLVAVTDRTAPAIRVALAALGAVALVLVLRAGPGSPGQVPTPRSWVWVAVLLSGAVLELADFLSQADARTDNPAHPTLSTVVEPLLDGPVARALAAAGWVLAGWWLVRIATERDDTSGASQ